MYSANTFTLTHPALRAAVAASLLIASIFTFLSVQGAYTASFEPWGRLQTNVTGLGYTNITVHKINATTSVLNKTTVHEEPRNYWYLLPGSTADFQPAEDNARDASEGLIYTTAALLLVLMGLSAFAKTAGYVVYLLPLPMLTAAGAIGTIVSTLNAVFAGKKFEPRWALILLITSLVLTAITYAMLVAEKIRARTEEVVVYEKPVPVSTVAQVTPVAYVPATANSQEQVIVDVNNRV